MQVIVFCLLGLVPIFFIEAIVSFLEWYEVACRQREFDKEKLTFMENSMRRTIELCKTHLGTWQKSNFNLIKVHNMKHYASSMRRFGAPVEYNTNMYEHLHIAIVKTGYRTSNRKNFLDHIVKYNRRLEALRKDAMRNGAYSRSIGKNATLEKMIAAEAPVLFAKACEMFILELTLRSWIHTEENKWHTLQRKPEHHDLSKASDYSSWPEQGF